MNFKAVFLILYLILFSSFSFADTPKELEKWKDWVLYENDKYNCPSSFEKADSLFCKWPGILKIRIYENRVEFSQNFILFKDTYVKLPGNRKLFPEYVKANKKSIPVTIIDDSPVIFPGTGRFKIEGLIKFKKLPDFIKLSNILAGADIAVKTGKLNAPPFLDKNNKLWLKTGFEKKIKKEDKNHLRVNIFRKIKDSIPCEIESLIKIHVSGKIRQEKVFPGDIKGKISFIKSPLPIRMNKDNSITIQVKPGTYDIFIKNIIPNPPFELGPFNTKYGSEIIVHENSPGIRFTRWENLKAVDPSRTLIPESWKNFSAFSVKPHEKIKIKESVRGIGKPEDNLKLKREVWLDFNGSGATIVDEIEGKFSRRSFLGIDKNKGITPGKITSYSKDQVLSIKKNLIGIPVESGNIRLKSVLRINKKTSSLLTGWNKDFSDISGSINIPPGWTVFNIFGAKIYKNRSFLSKWTLLDLFILCILSLAASKLWKFKWGFIFFISVGFLYHKFYIPPFIWLFLIIACAFLGNIKIREWLLKHKFIKFVAFSIYFSIIIIMFSQAVRFSYNNIQNAFYPQLAKQYRYQKSYRYDDDSAGAPMLMESEVSKSFNKRKKTLMDSSSDFKVYQQEAVDYGFIQTGTGVPVWRWQKINFKGADQKEIKLILFSPFFTRIIFIINVLLLWPLILRFIPVFQIYKNRDNFSVKNILPTLFIIALLGISISPSNAIASDFPDKSLLKEYEKRLTKDISCFPECAFIKECTIDAKKNKNVIDLKIDLFINSQKDIAIPVPDSNNTFVINSLYLNNKKYDSIIKQSGKIFTLIPKGIHVLQIKARSIGKEVIIDLYPIPSKLTLNSDGIKTRGIKKDFFHKNIRLYIPEKKEVNKIKSFVKTSPFPKITRKLILNQEWKVVTEIEHYFYENINKPLEVKIPLLKNEKVLKDTIDIKDEHLELSLEPGTGIYKFESELPISESINIDFPKELFQSQKWILIADPVWDYEIEGAKLSDNSNTKGSLFIPEPGDKIDIRIKKLDPYPGKFLSFDKVDIEYNRKDTKNILKLDLNIRSSKGLNHKIDFEEQRLTPLKLFINEIKQPLVIKKAHIILPISPGKNRVKIEFMEKPKDSLSYFPKTISFPKINLNSDAVNITNTMKYPYNTWIIASFGPMLGPGVLFWGYLASIIFAAFLISYLPLKSSLKPWQWVLFVAGLSMLSPVEIFFACSWFFIIEHRKNKIIKSPVGFNLFQIGLVFFTFIVFIIIYKAVSGGLLGIPDMQVKGNSSWHSNLVWFSDKTDKGLLCPKIILAPILYWKFIIFSWSIWIASLLINKIPYAIEAFKTGGVWKKTEFFKKKNKK